jgi:hypothetical protein
LVSACWVTNDVSVDDGDDNVEGKCGEWFDAIGAHVVSVGIDKADTTGTKGFGWANAATSVKGIEATCIDLCKVGLDAVAVVAALGVSGVEE